MKLLVCENYDEVSAQAAELFRAQIVDKPNSVLGLATGSTPIGMYKSLVSMNLDFSKVTTFNLDEYYPISRNSDQSYYYFMHQNLFDKININPQNVNIPNGETTDPIAHCHEYEKAIEEKGGIDIQVLGIGQNGHIGFNEPAPLLDAFTHVTNLTSNTIEVNSRFFDKIEDVPTQAITMGCATIMKARKIVLLACGEAKSEIISKLFQYKITTDIPASVLCMHPDVTVICDKQCYKEV